MNNRDNPRFESINIIGGNVMLAAILGVVKVIATIGSAVAAGFAVWRAMENARERRERARSLQYDQQYNNGYYAQYQQRQYYPQYNRPAYQCNTNQQVAMTANNNAVTQSANIVRQLAEVIAAKREEAQRLQQQQQRQIIQAPIQPVQPPVVQPPVQPVTTAVSMTDWDDAEARELKMMHQQSVAASQPRLSLPMLKPVEPPLIKPEIMDAVNGTGGPSPSPIPVQPQLQPVVCSATAAGAINAHGLSYPTEALYDRRILDDIRARQAMIPKVHSRVPVYGPSPNFDNDPIPADVLNNPGFHSRPMSPVVMQQPIPTPPVDQAAFTETMQRITGRTFHVGNI